ncbi:MAG: response regulator transcription factor, partial [Candidatus Saccharimonadales bacterium]
MAAKILLVEDDTTLSEIYRARLQAEGYEILSAPDGENALAIAVKEHPDLIISDVMMPKISGFDMLDILRRTDGVKDTKVIMMTALSQDEDKARANKLGADRYLVKSQVTLEDVIKVVQEVLSGQPANPPIIPPIEAPTPPAAPPADMPVAPVAPAAAAPPIQPVPQSTP